jgi:hypothetical protein
VTSGGSRHRDLSSVVGKGLGLLFEVVRRIRFRGSQALRGGQSHMGTSPGHALQAEQCLWTFFIHVMVMVCLCQSWQSIGKSWNYLASFILPPGEVLIQHVSFQASRVSELKVKREAKAKNNKKDWVSGMNALQSAYVPRPPPWLIFRHASNVLIRWQ